MKKSIWSCTILNYLKLKNTIGIVKFYLLPTISYEKSNCFPDETTHSIRISWLFWNIEFMKGDI